MSKKGVIAIEKNRGIWRGKRIDNCEWVKGDLLYDEVSGIAAIVTYVNLSGGVQDLSEINVFQVDPETVGQYTGLTDRNGVRIFEGDVVTTKKFNSPNKKYVIKYDKDIATFIGADLLNDSYFTTFDGDSDMFEVIGNAYDNPELLRSSGCFDAVHKN